MPPWSLAGGTAFLWQKEQLSTTTLKGFGVRQRIGLLLDMDERSLEYYLDGQRIATAFHKLPPGPLYPACSNGFDKTFCRRCVCVVVCVRGVLCVWCVCCVRVCGRVCVVRVGGWVSTRFIKYRQRMCQ